MARNAATPDHLTAKEARAVADVTAMVAESPLAPSGPADTTATQVMASQVLDRLSEVVPWASVSLSAYDPIRRSHRCVASSGYSDDIIRYLDDGYTALDPAYRWIVSTGQPYFSWETTEFDYSKTISARRYWCPSGYSGGSTSYVVNQEGRYVGNLHTSTERLGWPPRRTLSMIDCLGPVLAVLMDPWHDATRMLRREPAGSCSVHVDELGAIRRIPEIPCCTDAPQTDDLHQTVQAVLAATADRPRGLRPPPVNSWYLAAGRRPEKVTLVQDRSGWIATHRPADIPLDITPRQLQVCSLIACGMSNSEIAQALYVAPGTVRRHLDTIFSRTGTRTRAGLAALAQATGLICLADQITARQIASARAG